MIQLTPQMRLLLAVEPVDFRKGIDGLVAVCRQRLAADPLAGALFVFANRRRQALKLLVYDGQGFWLAQKRLSAGRFNGWPSLGQQPTLRLEGVASATARRRKKPAARVSAVFARGRRLAARAGNSARVSRYRQPRRLACNSKGTTGADVRALPWHGAEGR